MIKINLGSTMIEQKSATIEDLNLEGIKIENFILPMSEGEHTFLGLRVILSTSEDTQKLKTKAFFLNPQGLIVNYSVSRLVDTPCLSKGLSTRTNKETANRRRPLSDGQLLLAMLANSISGNQAVAEKINSEYIGKIFTFTFEDEVECFINTNFRKNEDGDTIWDVQASKIKPLNLKFNNNKQSKVSTEELKNKFSEAVKSTFNE